jgi:hypothetical protein
VKNQHSHQQSDDHSKEAAARTERRRALLRRKTKQAVGKAVRLAEDAAIKGASMSVRVARLAIQRIGRTDGGSRRSRIDVED